ncbi:kunitz-type protease inhibitor 2 [Archocentrus centrarchus]|uniref:kunitz-type protease inhibitor 2 n=1 Tax=Archocentrus centrarchus TaxID=63155 RepID=UPI0011E9B5F0|nr:kunitz-type serine protease inhibitor 6-like [Archocentrus centrarchus]
MIILKLLALGLLLASGLALDCDWDASVDPDQGLVLDYQARGARKLGGVLEGSDPDSCRAACCADPACDLAVVGFPADGPSLCQLVDCGDDQDACALRPTDQFKVYRKNVMKKADREAQGGGQEEHIVPLMDRWEPRTNESDNIHCRLPMKVGSCRAAFPRFFYNVTNQSCSSFIYGGCEANGNNFESQEDCEATCAGVTGSVLPESTPAPPPVKAPRMAPAAPAETDPESAESIPLQKSEMTADEYAEHCEAEPKMGPCRASLKHWYYNKRTGSCEMFTYGGCRGNKNNYLNKDSCMQTCTVSVLPSSKKHDDDKDSSDDTGSCTAKPDPGPCRAAFPMFYYDPYSASCQSFMYGGCRGNENRYSTEDECMRRCSEGWFDTHGKTRNRWTAAFFLFVTLAAISALLLTTLVVITLRRHRLFRRLSSNSDKEELLPDLDEQSSLDSLPLPESPKPDQKA